MKKHTGAIAVDQVIKKIDESKKKATRIENNCQVKAATMLGAVQIICGIVALAIWIIGNDNTFSFGNGIWTFTLFFVSGMLTIRVMESRNRWLIAASIVMSINSAVSAGFLLINPGISSGEFDDVVKVVLAGQMLIASVASVLLTAFDHLRPSSTSTSTSVSTSVSTSTSAYTSTSISTSTLGQPKLHESGSLAHSTILLSLISLKLMTAVKPSAHQPV